LLVFGKRAGEFAAAFAKSQHESIDATQADAAVRRALEPFERDASGEGPSRSSTRCRI
jgi:succinate dehydrogenase/fumarate reductase flavoprotein subunit